MVTKAAEKVEEPQNIYQLISKISTEAGALEPTRAAGGGVPFPFRGIDGVVNHLSPLLRKHGVVVVPEVLSIQVTPTPSGNRIVKTTEVVTRFTFYAPDGTSVSATTAGLADDFADRSTAQAQSVAFRVALLQTFTLPTQSPEPEETGQVVQDQREAPAVKAATKGATTKAAPKVDDVEGAQNAVREAWEEIHGVGTTGYIELGSKVTGKAPGQWAQDMKELTKVLEAVKKGEVA